MVPKHVVEHVAGGAEQEEVPYLSMSLNTSQEGPSRKTRMVFMPTYTCRMNQRASACVSIG